MTTTKWARENFCSYRKIIFRSPLLFDGKHVFFPPRSFTEYGKSVIGNLKLSCVTLGSGHELLGGGGGGGGRVGIISKVRAQKCQPLSG